MYPLNLDDHINYRLSDIAHIRLALASKGFIQNIFKGHFNGTINIFLTNISYLNRKNAQNAIVELSSGTMAGKMFL